MEVEARINRFDIIRMQIFLVPRLKIYSYWIIIFLLCAVYGGWGSLEKHGMLIWGLSVLVFTILSSVAFITICILYQLLFTTEKRGIIGKQKFRITESAFEEKSIGTETKTFWGSVEKIYKTKSYLYIQIGGYRVHIVPRRSFSNKKMFEKFFNEAQRLKANA